MSDEELLELLSFNPRAGPKARTTAELKDRVRSLEFQSTCRPEGPHDLWRRSRRWPKLPVSIHVQARRPARLRMPRMEGPQSEFQSTCRPEGPHDMIATHGPKFGATFQSTCRPEGPHDI